MSPNQLPGANVLRDLFAYDAETGELRWRCGQRAGKIAGCKAPRGHLVVRIGGRDGTLYYVHRIIWKLVTGCEPVADIDHINCIKADNRWENIREARRQDNGRNQARKRTGQYPVGVVPRDGKFRAKINVSGRQVQLGTFETPEQAHAAYLEAARKIHGQFFREPAR